MIYVEYEQINDADKILKEIEGHDVAAGQAAPNAIARQALNHELEFKLLLSRTLKGWNVAVNPLATKNLSPSEPWEFGYAFGASRPLALTARATQCNFCAENFIVGLEMYGGLGNTLSFGLNNTSQYLAQVVAWNLPSGWTLRISSGFGLNENSHGLLLRWGVSREFSGLGEAMYRAFGGKK